ncbi:nose resistant to fluoxetine protein 6 [Plutella xylostella]|uniref:nose resistant to fluoxetine protein 6 n=1 Tax=Plutella xylostella TaxID=51655 RepID=UPI0020323074|nr:nose resistant to fluoxetine protein 6 [Plutella xylostella]
MWFSIYFSCLCVFLNVGLSDGNTVLLPSFGNPNAFDQELYDKVLDPELCRSELAYIERNSLLRIKFLDAGLRVPRGIAAGNTYDYGNFHQCLEINEKFTDSNIEGKFCSIRTPIVQDLQWPTNQDTNENIWKDIFADESIVSKDTMRELNIYEDLRMKVQRSPMLLGEDQARISPDFGIPNRTLTLAICIPKTCTTKEAMESLYPTLSSAGLKYTDRYCRLPNDKPLVAADYVAFAIFGLIGLLTILSTAYDVNHIFIQKKEPKDASIILQSFSVYTNCKRLVTYTSSPKTIECLDGIRTFSIGWVILGHAYLSAPENINPLDILKWQSSVHSIFVTAAPISVDTFFFISGMLVVYTTAGKLKRNDLLKSLHIFYLNRLLRLFPILASAVLLTASWYNWITDGPDWGEDFTWSVDTCRTYWWSTLLHVQNYVNPSNICISQTWYLAVDIQLHILSPIILYWVLTSRKAAWISMSSAFVVISTAATIYNALMGFRTRNTGEPGIPSYHRMYYVNTLTRAAPFIVGMMFGYMAYSFRGTKLRLKPRIVALIWSSWAVMMGTIVYVYYPINQSDWDNQPVNVILNSYKRSAWALGLGWMVLACHHGYGGPLNWLLSLRAWKVPSRISYGMYIYHYQVQQLISASEIGPVYFSDGAYLLRYVRDLSLALLMGFLGTLLIDGPFGVFTKIILGTLARRPRTAKDQNNNDTENNNRENFKHNGIKE